jgi:hypothetical protein
MNRPQANEYPAYYQGYIDAVGDDIIAELENEIVALPAFLRGIPVDKHSYAYAEGKWNIIEVIGHIIDTERIMACRLLRIARNDQTPLPGFDENNYVNNAHFEKRTMESLAAEFADTRRSNMHLIHSLSEEEINRVGISNNKQISARALIFILAGHSIHHCRIIRERYLN